MYLASASVLVNMYPTDGSRASPWLFSVLVDTMHQSDYVPPPLIRNRRYYGMRDGILQIEDDHGMCCKWIRWSDALRLTVRTAALPQPPRFGG